MLLGHDQHDTHQSENLMRLHLRSGEQQELNGLAHAVNGGFPQDGNHQHDSHGSPHHGYPHHDPDAERYLETLRGRGVHHGQMGNGDHVRLHLLLLFLRRRHLLIQQTLVP